MKNSEGGIFMSELAKRMQEQFPVGTNAELILHNGMILRGIVWEYCGDLICVRRSDDSIQTLNAALIDSFCMPLPHPFAAKLQTNQEVSVVTQSGRTLQGTVAEWDDTTLQLHTSAQTLEILSFDCICEMTLPLDAHASLPALSNITLRTLAEPIEKTEYTLQTLQHMLKEDALLHSECSGKINSLQNAVKIREFDAKFQRTPRILAELIQITEEYYASEVLLALIGEVAILAGDEESAVLALQCCQQKWQPAYNEDPNVLRVLAKLSVQANTAQYLPAIAVNCSESQKACLNGMMAYYLLLIGQSPAECLPAAAEAQYQYLLRKLTEQPNSMHTPSVNESAADTAQATPAETSENNLLPPLLAGQRCGRVTLYIPANGFGVITDAEENTYSFVTHTMSFEEQSCICQGATVYFYKGKEQRFNKKKQMYVDIAEDITVMLPPQETAVSLPVAETPSPDYEARDLADKETGYIMLYRPKYKTGYICHEMQYGSAERGDIFFELADVINHDVILDTYRYHYKVAFNYVNGMMRRATNVIVLETLQKPELPEASVPAVQPLRSEDYKTLSLLPGVTVVAVNQEDTRLVGAFVSCDDHTLTLTIGSQQQSLPLDSLKDLLLVGLITSYHMVGLCGKINGQLPFRIHNVTDPKLSQMLKQGKHITVPCLYSLRKIGESLRIRSVQLMEEALCDMLPWEKGVCTGPVQDGVYFSLNDSVRCYEGTVEDPVIRNWICRKDILKQEALYRCVYHNTADSKRKDALSCSVVQICAVHQPAEVVSPLGCDGLQLQCGRIYYDCLNDLSAMKLGTQGTAVLQITANNTVAATDFLPENQMLPSYCALLQEQKQSIESELQAAQQQKNYAAMLSLYRQLLTQWLTPAEQILDAMFLLCIQINELTPIHEMLEEYGYLLEYGARLGYDMQLAALSGDSDAAAKIAKNYLSVKDADAFFSSLARKLLSGSVTDEELKQHISQRIPFEAVQLMGKIGMFNPITRQGNIIWEKGKLNFSYKDLNGFADTQLDLAAYDYYVSFDVDDSKHIPKAAHVTLVAKEAR